MTTDEPRELPREIEWTRDAAQRFWDYQGSDRRRWVNYFSKEVGDGLLDLVSRRGGLDGEVLDYGCGPGFLVERMLARGMDVTALDFSPDSLDALRERIGEHPGLHEVVHATSLPVPLADASFDRVFLVETVEHLMPDALRATLLDARRVLKPGGMLVATTPNEEDLESHKVMCPECGVVFHQRQHVSSWTAGTLGDLMEGIGMEVVAAEAVLLRPRSMLNALRDLVYGRTRSKKPHLVVVARKPSG